MKNLLLLVILLASPLYAVNEYYSLTHSIRSLGMGGAFYGWSNDEHALFYNPAGLSVYKGEGQGMLDINAQMGSKTLSAINTMTHLSNASIATTVNSLTQYQGTPLYANVGLLPYYLRKNFAVGLLLADTKVDFLLTGKELDSGVDLTAISDSGLVVGYGRSFLEDSLHVGINAKGIFRAGGIKTFTLLDFAQRTSIKLTADDLGGAGFGVDFDLGAIYDIENLPFGLENHVGLSLNNLLASKFTIARKAGQPPSLSRMASVGWHSVFAGWQFIDNFHVLVDFAEFNLGGEADGNKGARTGSLFKHVNLGCEMPIGRLAVRAGLHQGYLSAGLGLNLTYGRLEFATYGEELSNSPGRIPSRRYALTLALGMGSAPAPVITGVKETPIVPEKKDETPKVEEPKEQKDQKKLDPALELTEPKKVEPGQEKKSETKAPRKPQSEGEAVEVDGEQPTEAVQPGESNVEINP